MQRLLMILAIEVFVAAGLFGAFTSAIAAKRTSSVPPVPVTAAFIPEVTDDVGPSAMDDPAATSTMNVSHPAGSAPPAAAALIPEVTDDVGPPAMDDSVAPSATNVAQLPVAAFIPEVTDDVGPPTIEDSVVPSVTNIVQSLVAAVFIPEVTDDVGPPSVADSVRPSRTNVALQSRSARPSAEDIPEVNDDVGPPILDFIGPFATSAIDPTDRSPALELATPSIPVPMPEPNESQSYLIATSHPGDTMTRQGPALAIVRLHPEFAARLANAIREVRANGLPLAGIFSAYRPPAFGVGGFADKFNSLHSYGLAVDMQGIGGPGTLETKLWREVAARHGIVCPYAADNHAEWNHCQPTRIKIILPDHPLRERITAEGPVSLEDMFEVGNALIEDVESTEAFAAADLSLLAIAAAEEINAIRLGQRMVAINVKILTNVPEAKSKEPSLAAMRARGKLKTGKYGGATFAEFVPIMLEEKPAARPQTRAPRTDALPHGRHRHSAHDMRAERFAALHARVWN